MRADPLEAGIDFLGNRWLNFQVWIPGSAMCGGQVIYLIHLEEFAININKTPGVFNKSGSLIFERVTGLEPVNVSLGS